MHLHYPEAVVSMGAKDLLVLEALDELGSTRQVGVISHVKEVKAFIPCQVQLHKSMGGSSVTIRA